MSNDKKNISICTFYSKNKTDWFTDIHETLKEPGDTVWIKYRRRFLDGTFFDSSYTPHDASSFTPDTVKDSNEDLYTITMTIIDCGEIYNSGVIGVYDTVQNAEDAISHLCRNKQECIEKQNEHGLLLGVYEYYIKPSECYEFIIDKLKKNVTIGSTLTDVVLALES